MSPDPYDLERFVAAQDAGDTYQHAVDELRRGRKTSHWMWFVFPQVRGLGHSRMAERYAISSLDEAQAYLQHAVLGARLRMCGQLLLDAPNTDAVEILGGIDAQKLQSSMTLFMRADPDDPLFADVLNKYFDGVPDAGTDLAM